MTAFELHPQLKQDCFYIGRFELCQLLLINSSELPWYILVPELPDLTEIYQLGQEERMKLMEESCYLAENLAAIYKADKMNVASIGNMVPQLHIHHIVRYRTDKAWPGPVWGALDAVPYTEKEISRNLKLLKSELTLCRFVDDPS